MTTHAKERALQRYNSDLTDNDLLQMQNIIKNDQHIPLGVSETNKNMKFCYILYNHIPYKVLYRNKGKGVKSRINFITFYPIDVEEYNKILEEKEISKINKAITLLKSKGYIVYKRNKL